MRTEAELLNRITRCGDLPYIYKKGRGYVVWRAGTGDNIEILFLEVDENERRKGIGTELVKEFLGKIRTFHSVFVFHLASRKEVAEFYYGLGFTNWAECGIYKSDKTILRWASYEDLLKANGL